METFIRISQLIASLGLLILLHEFGHYITARMFKIRVEKFYLFFDFLFPLPGVLNFSLFKKKIGDTEYGIGWFPMGGYVSIAGMIDESLDTDAMAKPAEPWEFRAHPAWQRLIVMLGGIIVNVLLAFIIYAGVLFAWGEKKIPMTSLKDGIACTDSLGQSVGFKTGDKILSIDNKPIKYFDDLRLEILLGHTVQIDRNGERIELNLPKDFIDKLGKTESYSFVSLRLPYVFKEFAEGSVNKNAGLKNSDLVTGINDTIQTKYFDEFQSALTNFKNKIVTLNIKRNNEALKVPVKVTAEGKIQAHVKGFKEEEELEKLGVLKFERFKYGFFAAFPAGVSKTFDQLEKYYRQFKKMFEPSTGAYKHLSGFGGMTKMFSGEWVWEDFWNMTAFLSVILAFMNLLPIPALDGGHVVFTLYEMITRRSPSVKVLTYAQYVGMAFLLFIMLYANLNDVFHFGK